MKERFNRIDKIDWDSVVMEPMGPSEYKGSAPEYKSKGNKKIGLVISVHAFRLIVRLIVVAAFISLLYFGFLVFKGEVDAPELSYNQVIGLLLMGLSMVLYLLIGRKL